MGGLQSLYSSKRHGRMRIGQSPFRELQAEKPRFAFVFYVYPSSFSLHSFWNRIPGLFTRASRFLRPENMVSLRAFFCELFTERQKVSICSNSAVHLKPNYRACVRLLFQAFSVVSAFFSQYLRAAEKSYSSSSLLLRSTES